MTTNDYELLRVTTSDYKWLQVTASQTASNYEWLQVITSDYETDYQWLQVTTIQRVTTSQAMIKMPQLGVKEYLLHRKYFKLLAYVWFETFELLHIFLHINSIMWDSLDMICIISKKTIIRNLFCSCCFEKKLTNWIFKIPIGTTQSQHSNSFSIIMLTWGK